ncbi:MULTISPECIES: ABC transporter permease [unclassified Clostridium]|nr:MULTISPECIES: ABC transporter permease [unclassified Clostridium]
MDKLNFSGKRIDLSKIWANYSVGVIFGIIVLLSIMVKGRDFFSVTNIVNIFRNNSIVGIIALGMTFVIILGGIDLSVGSQLVGVGTIVVLILESTSKSFSPISSILLAVLGGIVTGIVLGGLNGLIITKGKVPAFIMTLGTMNIYRSVAQYFLRGGGFSTTNKSYIRIANYELFGIIPLPIIYFLVLTFIMHVISKYTRFGRYIYAVGSNEKAAKLSTINVNKIKMLTYTLIGLLVGIAAIIETSRMGSINPTSSGNFYEMDAISAVVVGGVSMSGGKGMIMGTFFGVLTIGLINNMMTLMGVPPFLVNATKGVIIVAAVLLQKKESD